MRTPLTASPPKAMAGPVFFATTPAVVSPSGSGSLRDGHSGTASAATAVAAMTDALTASPTPADPSVNANGEATANTNAPTTKTTLRDRRTTPAPPPLRAKPTDSQHRNKQHATGGNRHT
jgi:hypothetical protein